MADQADLLQEAQRRGLVTGAPDRSALEAEAKRRGLIDPDPLMSEAMRRGILPPPAPTLTDRAVEAMQTLPPPKTVGQAIVEKVSGFLEGQQQAEQARLARGAAYEESLGPAEGFYGAPPPPPPGPGEPPEFRQGRAATPSEKLVSSLPFVGRQAAKTAPLTTQEAETAQTISNLNEWITLGGPVDALFQKGAQTGLGVALKKFPALAGALRANPALAPAFRLFLKGGSAGATVETLAGVQAANDTLQNGGTINEAFDAGQEAMKQVLPLAAAATLTAGAARPRGMKNVTAEATVRPESPEFPKRLTVTEGAPTAPLEPTAPPPPPVAETRPLTPPPPAEAAATGGAIQETPRAQENVQGVSGEVPQRQEPKQARPVQEGGAEAAPAGGVLQAQEGEVAGGFDAEAFDRNRAETITQSKAAGFLHLDEVPHGQEAMRGLKIVDLFNGTRATVTGAVSDGTVNIKVREPNGATRGQNLLQDDLSSYVVEGPANAYLPKQPKVIGTKPLRTEPTAAGEQGTTPEEAVASASKLLEDKFPEDPKTGMTMYSGLPMEDLGQAAVRAARDLKDRLGVPESGVEITKPEAAKRPGVLSAFASPAELARKYPEIQPYVDAGRLAVEHQETLRDLFRKRMVAVHRALGGGPRRLTPRGATRFKANERHLTEIRLAEDALGRRFTHEELVGLGANAETIRAHSLIRSAYDHALGIANRARDLRGKSPVNRREGYVPHFFHNWFVIVDEEIIGSARTLAEAVKMGNPAKRAGKPVKIVPKQYEFAGEATQAAVIGDLSYFKLKGRIEKDFQLTPDEAQELLDGVARMKGRSRFVGNFLHRKGVPGFEKNLRWVDRHYFNMIARYAAMDQFKSKTISKFERQFGPVDKQYRGTPAYIQAYMQDLNGVPTRVEELLNNAIARTPVLKTFLGRYFGDRPSLQLAGMTTNAVAIAKLGMYNVSAALVNSTQFLGANAKLGERWLAEGLWRATAVAGALTKRAAGGGLKAHRDIGLLRKIGIDVSMGLESGSGYSKSAQMGRIFRSSTYPFQAMERLLRRSTALGAYYKGIHKGMTETQAIEYAREINREVNFDYSIADAPAFIRRSGPVGQVAFQFKKFPIKLFEFMRRLEGAEYARFWVPFVLLAGLYALPGMDAIKNMAKNLWGFDIELEAKKYLLNWAGDDPEKKAIAKTILYGAFANEKLGGIDISRRVGAGDLIPSQPDDLLGPAVSSAIRSAQLAAKGDWAETLRAISSAPGNLAVALSNDVELTSPWDRDRPIARLTPKDKVLKGMGFRTFNEAIETDVARISRMEIAKDRAHQKDLIDRLLKAELTRARGLKNAKTAAERDRVHQRDATTMAQINADMEKWGVGLSPDMVANEALRKELTRSERSLLNLPPTEAGKLEGVYKFIQSEPAHAGR